jgi:tetratricopeptide (TPR) repeat protein
MTRKSEFLKGPFFLLCLSPVVLLGEAGDTIYRRGIRPVENVTVTGETYTKVTYEMTGPGGAKAEGAVDSDSVLEVSYGDAPAAFQNAQALIGASQFENALKQLDEAAKAQVARPWPQRYLPFLKGECLRQLGRHQEAIAEYEKLLQGDPQSRLAPLSLWGVAQCRLGMAGENLAEAVNKFNELSAKDYPPIWKLRAQLGKALVKESQGMAAVKAGVSPEATALLNEALKEHEEILKLEKPSEEQKTAGFDPADERFQDVLFDAKAHKGMILVALLNKDEAEKWYTKLVGEAVDGRRREARAYNQRGDCFLAFKAIERALWDYRRVAVAYFTDHEQDQYALKRCVECFGQKGDKESADYCKRLFERRYTGEGLTYVLVEKKEGEPEQPVADEKEYAKMLEDANAFMGQKQVGQARKGQYYEYLGKSDDGNWAFVRLEPGKDGYVPMKSVEVVKGKPKDAPVPPEGEKKPETPAERSNFVTVAKDETLVYDEKRQQVYKAKKGEMFDVIDKDEGWYGIKLTLENRGIRGWINAQDVSYTPPRK